MFNKKDLYANHSQDDINQEFIVACRIGDLEAVDYFLTSSEIPFNAEINMPEKNGFVALSVACSRNRVDVVKFLANSSKLKQKANLHIQDDAAFNSAIIAENLEIINFFIFDMAIDKSKNIETILQMYGDYSMSSKYAIEAFRIRDLKNELQDSLKPHCNKINKSLKV